MPGRTFAIGDIHGDLPHLSTLIARLPEIGADDTLVFLGDYLDGGPDSAAVIDWLRALPTQTAAKVVTLRGNHEDSWLRVIDEGFEGFVIPAGNGCTPTLRSYVPAGPGVGHRDPPGADELRRMFAGDFFPPAHVAWLRSLPFFHEDAHAIYVHGGLVKAPDGAGWEHPSQTADPRRILWCRDRDFVTNYRGKLVVFGHTLTKSLPPELSNYTPEDTHDLWNGPCVVGLDTGSGKGGFVTALELPSQQVYESR